MLMIGTADVWLCCLQDQKAAPNINVIRTEWNLRHKTIQSLSKGGSARFSPISVVSGLGLQDSKNTGIQITSWL